MTFPKYNVAIEGDIVDIRNGGLYVNDNFLEEDYTLGSTFTHGGTYPIVIPDNHVFVLGDNREYSLDSRDFGPVAVELVESKVIARFPNTEGLDSEQYQNVASH